MRFALQPRNILKNTDIRTHKDCTSLPKDTGKTPADFDITKYPGFADSYVPLQSLDVSSVPSDRLSDYNMLIGSSNSSRGDRRRGNNLCFCQRSFAICYYVLTSDVRT